MDLNANARPRALPIQLSSSMRHCAEEYLYDSEAGAYVRFYAPFVPPTLPAVESTETTVVVQGNLMRLDQLAREYYGDEALWWVIALRNDLDLPDNQVYPGRQLYIPSVDYVRRHLLGGRR